MTLDDAYAAKLVAKVGSIDSELNNVTAALKAVATELRLFREWAAAGQQPPRPAVTNEQQR